jgi:hypothetical protein
MEKFFDFPQYVKRSVVKLVFDFWFSVDSKLRPKQMQWAIIKLTLAGNPRIVLFLKVFPGR